MGKIPVGKTMNVFTSQFLGFHFFALLYVEMDSTWVAWNNKMKNAVEGVQAKLTQIEYINAHTHTKKKILKTIAYIEKQKFIKQRQT